MSPSDEGAPPSYERALAVVGRALVTSGRAVGGQLARAYRSVDPDLRRHLAQMPLLGYSLLGSGRAPVSAGEPDGHPPLLFVHGLGGRRGDFVLMAAYLHLHGRRRSYRIQFDGAHTIAERASALADFVADVAEATGEPAVDVVAHSLGGLVVRLALCDHDLARRARLVITLGTPYAGTYSARYADTPITRELRPDSPLVRRMADTPWPTAVRGVSFWSRSDMLVLPPESAALPGTEAVEVTPFTHYSYLIDPRSWSLVREQLERFAPPTSDRPAGASGSDEAER